MRKGYVTTGTLSDGRRVDLDEAVPLGDSRVTVTIEPLASTTRPWREVLADLRRRQALRGHSVPTRDEIDRSLRRERETWPD